MKSPSFTRTAHRVALAVVGGALLASTCWAHSESHTSGADKANLPVLRIDAQVSEPVELDEMVVAHASQREGATFAALNSSVTRELAGALQEAAKTSDIKTKLGQLSTSSYRPKADRAPVWVVLGEVVLKSKNLRALNDLTGKLAENLQLTDVHFELSPERRKQVDARLLQEAGKAFIVKAQVLAVSLGFKEAAVREISVNQPDFLRRAPVLSDRAVGGAVLGIAVTPAPPEIAQSGSAEVSITVSGIVDLRN